MKVLGICSGRKNGNTEIMMKEAFRAIEEKCGAECNFIRLQEAFIHSCTGCETCIMQHVQGNTDFRCIYKSDSDHYYFIEQLMREADGIIVSSPIYGLMATGIYFQFINKLHASGDYRDMVAANPKVGAAFALGGTDWTNFGLVGCEMGAMELVGGFDHVVDSVSFDFHPAVGSVVLDDELLARMRLMGARVADALIAREKGEKYSYQGGKGVCPDCHGTMVEWRNDAWRCPYCDTKATPVMEDGVLKMVFSDEERAVSRFSKFGQDLHIRNIIMGHDKAFDGEEIIIEKRKEYAAYKQPIKLPDLPVEQKSN